jgi:NAD(P)-dependent dehydrogenase (short-subunit alcohol dehydrogenase family)
MTQKVVLVTGSKKGIGYGIIETLLEKKSKLVIILSARNEELGKKSYELLSSKYPDSKDKFYFHQLDITKEESIKNFCSWVKEKFGKLDYIVNNAGVATHGDLFNIDVCNSTFEVNVYGTINFTEYILKNDMINKSGKIIMVGSIAGSLNKLKNEELKNGFKNATTYKELLDMGELFKKSVINESVEKDGWCKNTYAVSKMIVNSYARVLALRDEIKNNDISVYSAHPGWVKTDMAGPKAPLSIKEGAETEVFLIELPDGINPEYQGKYFDKCKVSSFE